MIGLLCFVLAVLASPFKSQAHRKWLIRPCELAGLTQLIGLLRFDSMSESDITDVAERDQRLTSFFPN
jgi:hypothetical protein